MKGDINQYNLRQDLSLLYERIGGKIRGRISLFESVLRHGTDLDLFAELAFCLCTPQSDARRCWSAVEELHARGLLAAGGPDEVAAVLRDYVRFHNTKARNIVDARLTALQNGRGTFRNTIETSGDSAEFRDRLVRDIRGLGMKEASHFLRNIGLGSDFAILDRHILKVMEAIGLVDSVPGSMNNKSYRKIEEILRGYSHESGIPLSHLDLLFWYRAKGELFK